MSRDPRDDSSRESVYRLLKENREPAVPPDSGRLQRRDDSDPVRTWSAASRLDLPRGSERRAVTLGRDRFMLRSSESELLATAGAFRAIVLRDLGSFADHRATTERSSLAMDVRSVRQQGLLDTHALVINGRHESIAVLTDRGLKLIEGSRTPHSGPHIQRFYAGLVKPRELAHDAQLYRVFLADRKRLEAEGGAVTRVVLDDELKGDYHRYVHEQRLAGIDAAEARRAFADAHDLSFAGERIHLPDVRVEYEAADGRLEHRDLELATEHYSRSQLEGKVAAGFSVYRASSGGGRRGTPTDPRHLEWIE